jgi:hypothetical protein
LELALLGNRRSWKKKSIQEIRNSGKGRKGEKETKRKEGRKYTKCTTAFETYKR